MHKELFRKTDIFIFSSIVIIGIVLRVLWIIYVPTVPISDFLLYHKGAISIISGKGYRIYGHIGAYEPIGYAAILALLYSIFGAKILVAKISNVIFAVIGFCFLYFIVNKAFKNKKISYLCMLLYAILPINIVYTSVLSTEITFTALYLILIFLIFKTDKRLNILIFMGILLGILSLIKPYMMVYEFVIFLLDCYKLKSLKKSIKNLCIIIIFMSLTILPWTIRNYLVFNDFIPISTNGGYTLYANNNDYATGGWQNPFNIPNSPLLKYKDKNDEYWDEVKVDKEGKRLAFNWMVNNPEKFGNVGLKKLKNLFISVDYGGWATDHLKNDKESKYKKTVTKINKKVHYIMLRIMIIYFILIILQMLNKKIKNLYTHLFIVINIMFYVVVTFVFEGQPRYVFPLLPIFIICFGYVIKELVYLSNKFIKVK